MNSSSSSTHKKPRIIAPSILAADPGNLSEAIKALATSGADWVHLDVMDGHFVPNLTFGPPTIAALRPLSTLFFDTHLMIENPAASVDDYLNAGADGVTIHIEADRHIHKTLDKIRKRGKKAGVALNPGTPISAIKAILPHTDLLLVMSVNPGFGGQSFIPTTLTKLRELSELRNTLNPTCLIQVDGGINADNAPDIWEAGADNIVAGSAIFSNPPIAAAVASLRCD